MKTEEIKSVKVEFESSEADQFKSAIKKIDSEAGRIGFGSVLSADEIKLIRELNERINPK